jgi:hypothetical protein
VTPNWECLLLTPDEQVTNTEILTAIATWQADPKLYPLTCGTDSRHRPLVAVEAGATVYLKCVDCNYRQTYIPDVVIRAYPVDDPRR